MRQNLDKIPAIAREWFDEARSASTLAEAAFCHRKAQLALKRDEFEPHDPGGGEWIAPRRGSHRLFL